jgi:hypothetical protein
VCTLRERFANNPRHLLFDYAGVVLMATQQSCKLPMRVLFENASRTSLAICSQADMV